MITNTPKRIYLQIGGDIPEHEEVNFQKLTDVSWCEDKIYSNDICYIRAGVKSHAANVIERRELLKAFFSYLDRLNEQEFDIKSITEHGEDWLKSL